MKKLLVLLLCVPLMFSCGENKNDDKINKLDINRIYRYLDKYTKRYVEPDDDDDCSI